VDKIASSSMGTSLLRCKRKEQHQSMGMICRLKTFCSILFIVELNLKHNKSKGHMICTNEPGALGWIQKTK
jgi:hypothetical protein